MTDRTAGTRSPAKLRRGRMQRSRRRCSRSRTPSSRSIFCRGEAFATSSPRRNAAVIVAEEGGKLAGYALVLYPPRSGIARLYSIAVAPHIGGRGVGPLLLAAAEDAAQRRRRRAMRLEVHEHNTRAIARYEKSGYRLFGRHRDYYDDHADALRFEKPLGSRSPDGRPRRRKYRQNYLTPARESVLMVDKLDGADDAVAIRFVSGYDNLCLA